MHITRLAQFVLLGSLFAAGTLSAAEVYTWKGKNGSTSYSDVPQNLQPSRAGTVNVRTHTVTPSVSTQSASTDGDSLADKQKQLNDQIAEENRRVEEQNKKVEEQNRQFKEDNCKTARLNRQFAETARSANRDELMKRYDADVSKYCN
ncbi:Uncharacterised protein [Neisseria animaloris]|uniref:DUF4124 domain-containing protein n=1 Tax=Neisseria animaloris TaxID=326522 RepID=A0A1X3CHH1_9NEIS|nr:DUF4124 domain-containing protein [Neisseria animaloris]MDO5074216.1 DUF4124 domain-containing protein [Neisseria animaloris]OSI07016.1 DUF4124 domain-containing protein [Neisseria animaloris]VEH88136.1 Uncharacterised protein [Neisseria animaloris]VEJ21831.1 Uncharacterised protein [Neisseria animaloris]